MKQIERSFGEIVIRFFSIVKYRKKPYLKFFVREFIIWINLVIHVLFLERIVYFLESKEGDTFNMILLIYIIYIVIFEIVFFATKKWWWVETVPMWVWDIQEEYLTKYIKLDNNKVEAIWTGKLIWIINQWAYEWVGIMESLIEKGVSLIIAIIFTLYMVGKVELVYWLIFIWFLLVFYILWTYSNKKLWEFRWVRNELRNTRLKLVVKIIMSKIEILQTGKIWWEIEKNHEISRRIEGVNKDMSFHRVMLRRSSQFGMSVLLFISFWYLWNSFLQWNITLSVIVWLTGTLIIMQKTIAEMISFYVQITKRFIVVEKLWDFFDSTPEIQWYETGNTFEYKTWEIELKNMSFSYTKNTKIFDNFSLKIPWWKVIAFVGNSGSWKSTLVKIISWYLTHDEGEVIIDGQKNKDISLKSLYKHVGYLTQEPSVFDGSIRENLMYGLGELQDTGHPQGMPLQKKWENVGCTPCGYPDNLEKIISLAKCEFIYDFEDWLDTEIWEKWIRLSGGQRQRLAIAKIFLKNPEIIILDEPTSALDSFSEEQITIAMENLFKNRTVIIIAHRLQTVKNADKILVLENGKIVEEGTHKSLINQKWIYKKMLDLQSGF